MRVLVSRERELAVLRAVLDRGGMAAIEGGPGIGKTTLLDACVADARLRGWRVLRACGVELETGFAFGIVRQLFERELASLSAGDRLRVGSGPARAAVDFLLGAGAVPEPRDASFALLHGLYWLTANLAVDQSVLVAVDDAQWADAASMRWLAYVARRLEGVPVAVVLALRPAGMAPGDRLLSEIASVASVARPALLDEVAVAAVVRDALGDKVSDARCHALCRASGGNPFYLGELLRAEHDDVDAECRATPSDVVTRHVALRIGRLDAKAARLAGALAVIGDGSPLRNVAALADLDVPTAGRLATELTDLEVLGADDPPRFLHPIVRAAVESSLPADEIRRLHRAAASVVAADGAAPGRVAAHLMCVSAASDRWVCERLRLAARIAVAAGAAGEAGDLLRRALDEPPPPDERVAVLRELADADVTAGRDSAIDWIEAALALTDDKRARAEIAFDLARSCAALFRWVDAVDAIDRALLELGDGDPELEAMLQGELVVAGMHDARRAHRVAPTMARLAAHGAGATTAEPVAVARGMASVLTGRPDTAATDALEAALARDAGGPVNWDTRAALLWTLILLERFDAVEAALPALLDASRRDGSARGVIAVHSSVALLKYRLGSLPEADVAARLALRVLRDGDFTPGLGVGALVAGIATESGDLNDAQAILDATPVEPPGVISVLVPAARARLDLARGDGAGAAANFAACLAMFGPDVWGMQIRDVGYLHARSGAAAAQLMLGNRAAAIELADSELADARVFGRPRALGVALRVAGLAHGGGVGLALLRESLDVLQGSPAVLERAESMHELGAALRRAGQRVTARPLLAEALELATACGARPLADRARAELIAAGGRPRRDRRHGVDALTPSELRVARLAAEGQTNRQIAHSLYLTVKTVETHLAHAYAKLGISSRRALPDALA